MAKVPLALDVMMAIPRIDDGHGFLINWSGGLQSVEKGKNQWQVLPVQHDNKPHVSGFYTRAAMQEFMEQRGAKFVSFQQISWIDGHYTSQWAPLIPNQQNFGQSPADRWMNVASNLTRARCQPLMTVNKNLNDAQYEAIMDDHSEPERLARSIALSLRCLDNSVSAIADFYHEELTNLLADGSTDGHRHASMRDQALFALVHSFFLHIGSARDYLAAFVALKLGLDVTKIDSMARLIETLRVGDATRSPIAQLLATKGYIRPKPAPSTKWEVAGWLDEVTDIRNEFTHRRTYGQTKAERMGHLRPLDESVGLYRYFRPIYQKGADKDVFDVMIGHYEKVNELFFIAAELSGHDMSIMHLTDKDIISMEVKII